MSTTTTMATVDQEQNILVKETSLATATTISSTIQHKQHQHNNLNQYQQHHQQQQQQLHQPQRQQHRHQLVHQDHQYRYEQHEIKHQGVRAGTNNDQGSCPSHQHHHHQSCLILSAATTRGKNPDIIPCMEGKLIINTCFLLAKTFQYLEINCLLWK